MKKLIHFLASALFITGTIQASHADDSLEALNKVLLAYNEATINGDVDTILDYTYPQLFDLAPREQMQASLEQMFTSEGAPEIFNLDTNVDGPIQNYNDGVFTTVTASTDMSMKSPDPENTETNEFMLNMLQEQMGASSSVAFDDENGSFNISRAGKLIAINEGDSEWKLIDYEQALAVQATTPIIPEDIAEKLASGNEE